MSKSPTIQPSGIGSLGLPVVSFGGSSCDTTSQNKRKPGPGTSNAVSHLSPSSTTRVPDASNSLQSTQLLLQPSSMLPSDLVREATAGFISLLSLDVDPPGSLRFEVRRFRSLMLTPLWIPGYYDPARLTEHA
ncbi:hypothetical protein L210DRAFT_951239 [Boletus edulis BED1]|uniref:Uncharacterized protein n=1 Tax=Boletus edulis BED1 TaxID=1328754 RepID=A0AAD4G896_BOLED|nr:hypothetical protein L210DRAFT_951239 [Boletus edulis BED1]